MKKFFICAAVALLAFVADAREEEPQFVITDCGTVHQIPDNATDDQALDLLDYWTETDCG